MKTQEQELTRFEVILEWLGGFSIILMLFAAVILILASGCTPWY